MRKLILTAGLAMGFVSILSAAESSKDEMVAIAGSHIRQTVHRIGYSADTVAPVYIFDRDFIERTGATTVADVLRYVPQVRIRGF